MLCYLNNAVANFRGKIYKEKKLKGRRHEIFRKYSCVINCGDCSCCV